MLSLPVPLTSTSMGTPDNGEPFLHCSIRPGTGRGGKYIPHIVLSLQLCGNGPARPGWRHATAGREPDRSTPSEIVHETCDGVSIVVGTLGTFPPRKESQCWSIHYQNWNIPRDASSGTKCALFPEDTFEHIPSRVGEVVRCPPCFSARVVLAQTVLSGEGSVRSLSPTCTGRPSRQFELGKVIVQFQ